MWFMRIINNNNVQSPRVRGIIIRREGSNRLKSLCVCVSEMKGVVLDNVVIKCYRRGESV